MFFIYIASEIPFIRHTRAYHQYGNGALSSLFFVGFISMVALTAFDKLLTRALVIGLSVITCFFFQSNGIYLFVFGVLLASIIHVSLFTVLFMFQGALRTRSTAGYFALLVYASCLAVIAFFPLDPQSFSMNDGVYDAYIKSGFHMINAQIGHHLFGTPIANYDLFSAHAIRIQVFIAFAYTYHYLNWFSKIDIIRWNHVPKRVARATLLLWILSVALYMYDYRIGLFALLSLSLLHVFLEFPLNYRSIVGIWNELSKGSQHS